MEKKPYNSADHVVSVVTTKYVDTSVWCHACGSGFSLSHNGVRHQHADEHEALIGQPHTWFNYDYDGNKISDELQACGHNYELATWEGENRERVCSCGEPVQLQYDQFNIPCGYMCETKFLNTYRQDRYDPAEYGERIEPLD